MVACARDRGHCGPRLDARNSPPADHPRREKTTWRERPLWSCCAGLPMPTRAPSVLTSESAAPTTLASLALASPPFDESSEVNGALSAAAWVPSDTRHTITPPLSARLAMYSPRGSHATPVTHPRCPCNTRSREADLASQIVTLLSICPHATRSDLSHHATSSTSVVLERHATHFHLAAVGPPLPRSSQTSTLLSSEPLARYRPLRDHRTQLTAPLCRSSRASRRCCPDRSASPKDSAVRDFPASACAWSVILCKLHIRTRKSPPPVAMAEPDGCTSMLYIGLGRFLSPPWCRTHDGSNTHTGFGFPAITTRFQRDDSDEKSSEREPFFFKFRRSVGGEHTSTPPTASDGVPRREQVADAACPPRCQTATGVGERLRFSSQGCAFGAQK